MAGPYDALIAGWGLSSASAGALPRGVTGASLFGLSTAAKTAAVILWTIPGPIPPTVNVAGYQLANCIIFSEFNVLVQSEQSNILTLCNNSGPLLGGSTGAALLTGGMFLNYFGVNSQTIKNLTALITGTALLWWPAPVTSGGAGVNAPTSQAAAVIAAAGLS